jgi:enolase-phosphatase E1
VIAFGGRGILLDIEGTVAPISFVTETLFPFAHRELAGFLARRWDDPAVQRGCEFVARDAGATSFAEWSGGGEPAEQQARLVQHLHQLMDSDIKATGLKELQGLIWDEGYRAGLLRSPVYPDVVEALQGWQRMGLQVRIYSSGSVAAQKKFFAKSEAGDLTPLLAGFHDTTTGPKREASSYARIAQEMGIASQEILFISDVVAELEAASSAGLAAVLAIRPGNAPQPGGTFPTLEHFGVIQLVG